MASPDCSLITWTFYKGGQVRYTKEVIGGQVRADSDKSGRISITSNCSVYLIDLRAEDAGSYVCLKHGSPMTDVYLSLLAIFALSNVNDLQLGGNLILRCSLFTFYDAGSCQSYSNVFELSWVTENGTPLPNKSRYELNSQTRCNITLITKLQMDDNNRKWRCQMKTTQIKETVFQDFKSAFLFENPSTPFIPSPNMDCPVQLPISRIMLCLALPVMLIIMGGFTWRGRRKKETSAAGIGLQEVR
uniref:Ig-like domain-containing protein n=1 Tax=Echeneis naucrates TaxID=173247 RepID=A0A665TA33_ECHNA